MDVSARGTRLRVTPDLVLAPGCEVEVEFAVADARGPEGFLPVRVIGHGTVLRWTELPEGGCETAVRFDEPLLVCEPYPASGRARAAR